MGLAGYRSAGFNTVFHIPFLAPCRTAGWVGIFKEKFLKSCFADLRVEGCRGVAPASVSFLAVVLTAKIFPPKLGLTRSWIKNWRTPIANSCKLTGDSTPPHPSISNSPKNKTRQSSTPSVQPLIVMLSCLS